MGNSVHSRNAKDNAQESASKAAPSKLVDDGNDAGYDKNSESALKHRAFEMELDVKPEPLTEKQMAMLQENWKELEDNIAKVGVITFISLFETHPDVQDVFIPFKGMELDELRHSKQLKAHALRVMAFVQKAVARLYEPEKLDLLLRELGKKHYSYGAKQQYIDYIAPQFIQAIKPSLEDRWTGELQDAWIALFNYMGVIMKAAMEWEEKRAAAATIPYALPPSSHPTKTGAPAPVNPIPPANPAPPIIPPAPVNPPPPVVATTNSTKEPNRRASSDVVSSTRKVTGVKTEALRRGTLN